MQPAAVGKFLAAFRFRHKGFNGLVSEFSADTPSHDYSPGSISLDTPGNTPMEIGCHRILQDGYGWQLYGNTKENAVTWTALDPVGGVYGAASTEQ